MPPEVVCPGKGLPADVADKRFFAPVELGVFFQIRLLPKRLAAQAASETEPDLPVDLSQVSLSSEID